MSDSEDEPAKNGREYYDEEEETIKPKRKKKVKVTLGIPDLKVEDVDILKL